MSYKIMAIFPDGQVKDLELPNEPAVGQTLEPEGGRKLRIVECHQSAVDTWDYVVTLVR